MPRVRCHPQESLALEVVTYVGLSVSLVCLFLAIVTFLLCRSLWTISVSLHLQLSICLFAADLLFLVPMSPTDNQVWAPWGLLEHLETFRGFSGSP